MKLHELQILSEEQLLLNEQTLDLFLEYFTVDADTPLLEDGEGGDSGSSDSGTSSDVPISSTVPDSGSSPGNGETPASAPPPPPVQPPGNGAWYGGFGGGMWLNMFARQVGWLAVSSNVKKRLKELGIKGDSIDRIDNQIKMAKHHIDSLLQNPQQFKTKQFTYAQTDAAVKKLNDNVKATIKKSLVKLPKGTFLPGSK